MSKPVMIYLLITPARNEEAFIEHTMRSVVNQTCLPLKWVIVSDGSTDATDEIVGKYADRHSWIELVSLSEREQRDFSGKARAFNEGYARVKHLDYDVIGNLDADISFAPSYFEYLLRQFSMNPRLGVAGTPFREGNSQYDYRFSRPEHVSGACQLFRRECFASVGGYLPLKEGAIDLVAVVTARMQGWLTQSFTGMSCEHHRRMGSAQEGLVRAAFKSGYGDYRMGVHPVWQLLRSVYQMTRRPFVVSGSSLLAGYLWGLLHRPAKPVSTEFIAFRHREQLSWLKEYVLRTLCMPFRILRQHLRSYSE